MNKPVSHPLLGIGLLLCAMAVLPFLDVCAKILGRQGIPVVEIVWARMLFGALISLPFAARLVGWRGLTPDRPIFHAFRAVFLMAATGFFFWGLHYLSIADTLAIFFIEPLVITALSPVVLGETVGLKRWIAVLIGFIGTLIIIRPGLQAFNPGVLMALASGTSIAIYLLMTRRIAGRQPAMVTTFHTNALGSIFATIAVVTLWVPPLPAQWSLMLLLAAIAVAGHYLIVRAYDYAEASLLAPLAYTEIIMATFAGWWFFGDFPDRWTFLGVGILIACAIYISLTERNRAEDERDFEQP